MQSIDPCPIFLTPRSTRSLSLFSPELAPGPGYAAALVVERHNCSNAGNGQSSKIFQAFWEIKMGRVRPFVKDDIPHVADLDMRVWHGSDKPSSQALRYDYEEIFFHNPWYNEAFPSLVYQEDNGKISGFMGVIPRRMLMNERPVQVVINTHGMVDPNSRFAGVSTQIAKTCYSGPQDLTISDEVNDAGYKVCEKAGATMAPLYSIHWMRILRPSRYVRFLLKRGGLLAPFAYALGPFCRIMDVIATRMPQSPFRQLAPSTLEEELTVETLLTCLSDFSTSYSLRPAYDNRSLLWLLEMTARKKYHGTFRKVVVRNTNGDIRGWYLYYLNPGGISEVLQIGARKNSIDEVLDHLFYHAWRQGAVALSGRLESRFIREFANKRCLFLHSPVWAMVHSNKPELLQALHYGDAFITRLEGELPVVPSMYVHTPSLSG